MPTQNIKKLSNGNDSIFTPFLKSPAPRKKYKNQGAGSVIRRTLERESPDHQNLISFLNFI